MKAIIIIIEDKPKRTPINKGKKLEELYDPKRVKAIRRKITRGQRRRWENYQKNGQKKSILS